MLLSAKFKLMRPSTEKVLATHAGLAGETPPKQALLYRQADLMLVVVVGVYSQTQGTLWAQPTQCMKDQPRSVLRDTRSPRLQLIGNLEPKPWP